MMINSLPTPDADAVAHSEQLKQHIVRQIAAAGGWLDFAQYMDTALYAPGLGYYSAGAKKFGPAGDFVTAPELSPLFARTIALQAAEVLHATDGDLLELGAGSGRLAGDLLMELDRLGQLPSQYRILEVSAHLRQVQKDYLQKVLPTHLMQRVGWLESLPAEFSGLVLGNEVLDALPVHVVQQQQGMLIQRGVGVTPDGELQWMDKPADAGIEAAFCEIGLPDSYTTEICLAAGGLVASLGRMLQHGLVLLIDYGFPRHEYYHPQRQQGTLMCHYRHHAHGDPFLYPGLQDITAHVDFTRVAEAAMQEGLDVMGYANQAQFLINCGITECLAAVSPHDLAAYAPLASAAQKLLSPAEMGELFKVIALGRGMHEPLRGFSRGDKRHTL
jgi:SAM-dependent MidA family methyltransferase